MLPELLTAGDRSHSAAPHIQTEKHTDSYLHLLPYFPLQFLSTHSVLPLWPASSDTPAAAAGSRSWGRRRSGQPWLRTGTPPSRSEWRSSGRPPPWWCCGRRLPGCSKDRTGQQSAAICHRHRNTWKGLTETDWKIKLHLPGFQFPVLPAEVFTYQCTRQAPPFRRHSWMKPMHSLKCCELGKKNNNIDTCITTSNKLRVSCTQASSKEASRELTDRDEGFYQPTPAKEELHAGKHWIWVTFESLLLSFHQTAEALTTWNPDSDSAASQKFARCQL